MPATATRSNDVQQPQLAAVNNSNSSCSNSQMQCTDAAPDVASKAAVTPAAVAKPAHKVKVASHEWLHRAMSPSDWSYSPPPSCSPRAVGAQLGRSSSDMRSTPASTTTAGATAAAGASGHVRAIEAFPLSESCCSEYDETDESVRSCDVASSTAGDCDGSVLSVTIPPLYDEDFDCALSSKSTGEHAAVRSADMRHSCSPEHSSSNSNSCNDSAVAADAAQGCADSCVAADDALVTQQKKQQQQQQQKQLTAASEHSHSNSSSSSDAETTSSTAVTQSAETQTVSDTATPIAVAATAATPLKATAAACTKRRRCTAAVSLGASAAAAALGLFMVQSYAPWWLQFGSSNSSSSSGSGSRWRACDVQQHQRSSSTDATANTDQCLPVHLSTSSSSSSNRDTLKGLLLEIVRSSASSHTAAVRISRTPIAAGTTAGANAGANATSATQQQQHILIDIDNGAMRLWAAVPTTHSSTVYSKQQYLQLLGLCPGEHTLRTYVLSADGSVTASSSSSSFTLPPATNDTGKHHLDPLHAPMS
jgi:hypothetical protein